MFKEFIECDKCKKMREILKDDDDINFYEKIVFPVLEKMEHIIIKVLELTYAKIVTKNLLVKSTK